MSRGQPSFGGRRSPVPPSPLQAEVPRGRLLEVLAGRFDAKITVVVAGAGFGKTTALAQAIRANEASPRGIDAWVACQPGDEDAGRLAAAIIEAVGSTAPRGSNIERVLDGLRNAAPVDVCVVLDDLHELPPMSAGHELIRELAAQLPAHAHLVLASRVPVTIPLARRRAAGEVIELGVDQLAFSSAEIDALASELGGDRESCAELAGWPSLVRLVLAAPHGALRQFLWEEVVAGLPPDDRAGLLALAVLGSGSAVEIASVAGASVDLDRLLATVPLLHRDPDGGFGAHDLWAEAADRVFAAPDVTATRARALHALRDRGDTVRMGSAASRWRHGDVFREACIALVLESLGALPIDTATRWLADAPPDVVGAPELRLLDLALRSARGRDDADLDAELDQLAASFAQVGDERAQAVTLAMACVAAHTRGDALRLILLAERIRVLPDLAQQPLLQFFVDAVDAALASLRGDVAGALATIDSMSFNLVPSLVRELVTRLQVVMLMLAGRADEALEASSPLLESPHAYVRSMVPMLRWATGDPTEYLATPPLVQADHDANHRDRFIRAAHGVVVAASLGDRALAHAMRGELDATRTDALDARDSAIASTALACWSVMDHDEPSASAIIADHLDRHPLDDALGEVHMRRCFAVGYVCNDAVRARWDDEALGVTHRQVKEVAQQLLDARAGRLDRQSVLAPPSSVVCALPLAWSMELGVRAAHAGSSDGTALVRSLVTWLPAAARRELEWLAENGDDACVAGAVAAWTDLPTPDQAMLTIDVLGPMRVRLGDRDLIGPELRRSRVRALLTLLVLRSPMRRERICDLLWPDHDAAGAAQNLRVTLSRLRRLIEPPQPDVVPVVRVLVNGDLIGLAPEPVVDTDLARLHRALADAAQARRVGDSSAEVSSLERALVLWRGDPMPDLDIVDEVSGEIEFLARSLVDACLRVGELHLAAGRFDESLRSAERARLASPYSERAHRLAIACHLQQRDAASLAPAVAVARRLFDELGVEPDESTMMLLRRADERLSTTTDG